MLTIFTNKTLNYKVYTGSFDNSTGNHTLIYETLWPLTIFNSKKSEKYTSSKNFKIPLCDKVT